MGQRLPEIILQEMLDSIHLIHQYTQGMDEDDFLQNNAIQDAVVRRIEILGEASTHLSPQWRTKHPHIPWKQISAMRNRLIHAYFSVNARLVWQVVQQDLLILEQQLADILTLPQSP